MTTPKPYTDADVERVARSLFDADQRRLVTEHAHLPGVTQGRWSDMPADTRRLYEDRSRAALDAVATAGRLREPGATPVTTNEKRVVLIKPADVLLIGNLNFRNAEQGQEAMRRFKQLTGITPVVFFADDIQIDAIPAVAISDEIVDAYVRAHDAVWQADAPISQGEAVATHRRAVRAGLEAALDLAHPFMPGGADSTFGAAGTWCAMPVGDDQCGLPPEAHTRTPRSQP